MNTEFDNKEYRDAFVEELVRTGVAFQVRALRAREGWSQAELGERCGKQQNVISRIENPDYGKITITTLLNLASALDVAVLVRFVSFSDLWNVTRDLSQEALVVDRYADEKVENTNVEWETAVAPKKNYLPQFTKRLPGTEAFAINTTTGATPWQTN